MIKFITRWYSDCRPEDFPFTCHEIGWRMQSPSYAYEASIPANDENEIWSYIRKDFPDFEKISCLRNTPGLNTSPSGDEKPSLTMSKSRITPVKKIVKVKSNLNKDKQKFRKEIEKYLKVSPLIQCNDCGALAKNTPGNNTCKKCGSLETILFFDLEAAYHAFNRLRTMKIHKK